MNSSLTSTPFSLVLKKLSKLEDFGKGDLHKAFAVMTEIVADTLSAERVGIWILNSDQNILSCVDLFEKGQFIHVYGLELTASNYPTYFAYLAEERVLAAHDVLTDQATQEFVEEYLKPLNITSMLDAPISRGNGIGGVLCIEHVGPKRTWTLEEQAFAASVADLLARGLEIQERVDLQAKLYAQTKMSEIGLISGGIAHELATPLTIIKAQSSELNQALNNNSNDEAKKCAQKIMQNIDRIERVIRSLLSLSHSRQDDPQLSPLSAIIDECLILSTPKIRRSGAEIRQKIGADAKEIFGRHEQITLVLVNLVNNACDAIAGSESPWIELASENTPDGILISVTNSGPPIDPEIAQKCFQSFFTTKPKNEGTGLGLNVARKIIESHRGKIWIDLNSNKTRFCFITPHKTQESVKLSA